MQKSTPYVLFVGQLSYKTESSGIFKYFKKGLGEDHPVTSENLKVRLLTTKGGGGGGRRRRRMATMMNPKEGRSPRSTNPNPVAWPFWTFRIWS